jgi:hypothetical protein
MKTGIIVGTLTAMFFGGWTWAGSEDTNQVPSALRLELDLVDGSHVIGIPKIESVPVQTPYARMDIPLKQILSVRMDENHETASLDLVSGDRLKGVITLKPFEVTTLFGPVKIGIEHLRVVRVAPGGGASLPENLRKGLILYYAFDQPTGDVVIDNSGNRRQGVAHGTKWIAGGRRGGAMMFDGKSSFIESGDAGLPMADAPRSIAFWFKLREGGTQWLCEMMYYGTQNQNQMNGLGMDWREGRDSIAFTQCGGVFVGATKMAFDRWYHVVYVYGGQGSHKFYVDGRESSGVNELGSIDTLSSGKLIVGAHPQRQQFFDGWMDELMIYDRALSVEEVSALFGTQK